MIDRVLTGELARYGVSGAMLAALYSTVYWTLAAKFGMPVLLANTIAFCVNLIAGWLIHSRWSFGNRRLAGPRSAAYGRFFLINFGSYALNSLWVWLIVDRLGWGIAASIIPVVTVTPALTFALTRGWIFARKL